MLRKALVIITLAAALTVGMFATLPAGASNDRYFDTQWGLERIQAPKAWATSAGTGVVVAVLDTGVDFTHPDLENKMKATYTCIEGGCRKNQEAGDIRTHGTHVAGVIGAETGNQIGVASVAPKAMLMSVRVLCGDQGPCADDSVGRGIRYATQKGAKVINLSLEARLFGTAAGQSTVNFGPDIEYAWDAGVVVVGASGNQGDAFLSSYAAAPHVLVVGATGPKDERSAYTSGTESELDIDLFAPGGNAQGSSCGQSNCIISTVPGTGYSSYQGTSMAAPHVSGVAALLSCQGLSNDQIVSTLKSTADRTSQGLLRVNAAKAVASRPGGNCGASYPGPDDSSSTGGGGTSTPGRKPATGAPSSKQGATQPGQPAAGQPQPTNTGPTYIDPTPRALGSEDKKKGVSSKLVLNLGIGAVLLAGVIGYFSWMRRKRTELTEE